MASPEYLYDRPEARPNYDTSPHLCLLSNHDNCIYI